MKEETMFSIEPAALEDAGELGHLRPLCAGHGRQL